MIIHVILVLLFLVVVALLFQALFFLVRDHGDSRRTVIALTLRIGMAILLFVLIITLWLTGLLKPAA